MSTYIPDTEANTQSTHAFHGRRSMAGGGGGDELKLLGTWVSPVVLRVTLALRLKGLSYEYVEENLKNKSELLLKSNPVHQKVPVLIHGANPVCESCVIVQYIDEAFAGAGPALLPADPYDRAVARFWAAFVDDTLVKAMYKAAWGKTEEEKAEGEKQAADAVVTLEGGLRECSKGKHFFGGDSAGYVDVVLGGLLAWVRATEAMKGVKTFDPAATPLLAAWADRFGALEAVEQALPDVGRLVDFAMAMQAQARAATAAAGAAN